jgi:hypothetical protein
VLIVPSGRPKVAAFGVPLYRVREMTFVDGSMLRFFKAVVLAGAVLAVTPALANEFCDKEMAPFFEKKKAIEIQMAAINKQAKKPGAREKFCATMGNYIGNLRGLIAYIEKNKDFCAVPDDQVGLAQKGLAQNISLRKKVCSGPPPQARAPKAGGGQSLPPPPVTLRLQ